MSGLNSKNQPRKQRPHSDSLETALELTKAINNLPEPPDHIEMSETDLIHFNNILVCRPLIHWNEFDLSNAAQLAKSLTLQEKLMEEVSKNGPYEQGERGMTETAASKILDSVTRRNIATARYLQIHGEVRIGQKSHQSQLLETQNELLEGQAATSDLLA